MTKPFIIILGIPTSGKINIARQLTPSQYLPLLDREDILESLFEYFGIGDAEWLEYCIGKITAKIFS